ncbi:MAG: amidohydrolase, partial [Pseudomonadales bacterium]
AQPWAEALAIKDGRYVFVGGNDAVQSYIGSATEVVDLQGKMAMPGINDMHVHPVEGGTKELFECSFPFTAGPDEIANAVAGCVGKFPDATWIRGGQWSSDFFVDHKIESPRKFLDRVSGDKAVALVDDAYHNAWFNTKALELLGISKDSEPPPGVEVAKDATTGQPTGIVIEAFGYLKDNLHWSEQQYEEAAAHALKTANSYGITGLKATALAEGELKAFHSLAQNGAISAHVATALVTPYGHRQEPLDIAGLQALRDKYRAPNVHTDFAKIFMDGVPTASRTAAMLAPYTLAEKGAEFTNGQLHIAPELLTTDIKALDKAGFTVKIHTAGDRSVRVALDAIESARKANGRSGLRHELAHAGYVDPQDIDRFAALNVIPDFSPYIWFPSPIMDSVLTAVGERGEQYWPTKTLLASGAFVAIGSDWPAAVPSINPWPGIEALVTRADPYANTPEMLWQEEAITLERALRIFTYNSARALKLEEETGSIETGKSADLIVLNHNLFKVPITEVSDTQPTMTFFAGKRVYEEPVGPTN